MEWLNVNSVEDLKKFGKMNNVKLIAKKDIESLFKDKKSKEKNIVNMISINSGSWVGLYQKIVALREVISYLDDNVITKNFEDIIKEQNHSEEKALVYFNSKEAEYIFYLLELDGKQRADKLNITMKCYSNKNEAKAWRDSIAKVIHPDKCKNKRASEAICKLNQLYEDMIG